MKSTILPDPVVALESALKILERKNSQNADAGACLWIAADGRKICVRLTHEDCDRIPGMVFVGGTCEEAAETMRLRSGE